MMSTVGRDRRGPATRLASMERLMKSILRPRITLQSIASLMLAAAIIAALVLATPGFAAEKKKSPKKKKGGDQTAELVKPDQPTTAPTTMPLMKIRPNVKISPEAQEVLDQLAEAYT